ELAFQALIDPEGEGGFVHGNTSCVTRTVHHNTLSVQLAAPAPPVWVPAIAPALRLDLRLELLLFLALKLALYARLALFRL
ncbi:hypothetical protein, partial [Klebsiella pneumoniae]|uniref:hypothetical protein n=1 Tax=Klebsiella pneumoniae TaxID=573 RepID=UPI00272FF9C0